MPITLLRNRLRATLCDITCDSDGRVGKFVDLRGAKQALELHGVNSEPYYLAIFWWVHTGISRDEHNLLGSANEAHFLVGDSETALIR